MRRFALLLLLFCAACGDPVTVVTRAQALGEPLGDYPSYAERLVLYLTNRARTAPTDFNPDDPYPPTAPLQFDYDLTVAARFHARHIIEEACWCEDHSSCCELGGTGEEVACAGPTTGCGAFGAAERVNLFSSSYAGENMARGQLTPDEAVTGWTFSPGHWQNMNSPAATRMGAGNFETAWVQDFGGGSGPSTIIPDGIHFAAGQGTTFATTYRQGGSGGPQTALVIVDGECHDLGLAHGEPEQGAFETTVNLGTGCHRYYFQFTDGNGNDVTYPSFGSFGAAVGTSDCEFFIDTRPADTCSPSGQTCMTGDTRHCYTGPFGTEDVGVCEAGVERCVAGQWDGDCRLQVAPTEEACNNALDDDCDGEVDEECPSPEDGAPDAGNADTGTTEPSLKSNDSDGGCRAVDGPLPGLSGWLIVMMAALMRRLR